MIRYNGKNIDGIYIFTRQADKIVKRTVTAVYHGVRLVWRALSDMFAGGFWRDDCMWNDDDFWTEN